MKLAGAVAVVTGASRGIGKGCALELGALGATVYVTGRSVEPGKLPGTVGATAEGSRAPGQPRSTVNSGSVFSRTSSSVTPGASSRRTSPSSVTSNTARSVMIRWTTPRPV